MKLTNTSSRDIRQINILNKWAKIHNFIGGVKAFTGFGKTVGLAIRAIKLFNIESIIFVVPTLKLQEDTKALFSKFNINGEVLVINTASKNSNHYNCDLLIIDEVDKALAETFINIFNTIAYNKLMWITATLERKDGKHDLLLKKAPLVDTVSMKECITNKWVEPLNIYKVPVILSDVERNTYNKLNEQIEILQDKIGGTNPMEAATNAIMYLDRNKWVVSRNTGIHQFKSTVKKWFNIHQTYKLKNEKKFYIKQNILKIQKVIVHRLKLTLDFNGYNKFLNIMYVKPSTDNLIFEKALNAKKYLACIRKRKDLLYNAEAKLTKTLELIENNKDKYKFVIGQKIEFLEILKEILPDKNTGIYHSKLSKKQKETFFKNFLDGRTKMKTLLSAKSLIEGIDIPKLEVIIVSSYTSSKRDATQLKGRISRLYPDKQPELFYLYCKDTIEETSWLKKITQNVKITAYEKSFKTMLVL